MPNITDRVPPQAVESEIAFLGSVLRDGSKMIDVFDDIRDFYFSKAKHQKIYDAMEIVFKKGDEITVETVQNELVRNKNLDSVGGIFALDELADSVPSSASILSYAKIIKEKWIYRNVITTSYNILSKAFDQVETNELLEEIGKLSLIDNVTVKEESFRDMLHKFNEEVESRENGNFKLGIKTGLWSLDNIIGEFFPGELVTIGGHTSTGKSALALQIANFNCVGLGKPVGIIGMEMTKRDYVARLLSMNTGVNLGNIHLNRLTPDNWTKIAAIQGKIADAKFHISDKPRLNIHEIRSIARQWKRKFGIEMLIIDNLKNMKLAERDSMANSIEDAVQDFKALGKELDLVPFILAHISRDHEKKYKRPTMQDLKGSSAFEQDSDSVMFTWLPYKFDYDQDNGQAEIYIDKRRNGPTGTTNISKGEYSLQFVKECAIFKELGTSPF